VFDIAQNILNPCSSVSGWNRCDAKSF